VVAITASTVPGPEVRAVQLVLGMISLLIAAVAAASDRPAADAAAIATTRVQVALDDLRLRLGLSVEVTAAPATGNPLLVSVEAPPASQSNFVLSFDPEFVAQLNDDELRAVVAHELGHVWIFTHHPYLQTERLANSIAMRVVSRDALKSVYTKVWERSGAKADVIRVLGVEPQ
jgi:hypothetical protein